MARFVGRQRQLNLLHNELDRAGGDSSDPEPGRCVLIRGRRRVGKSRLVEEFIAQAGVPSMFFTASRRGMAAEVSLFVDEAARSSLPGAALFAGIQAEEWEPALRLLGRAVPESSPAIVVIDELPYLIEDDPSFDATLQKLWDRHLKKQPILLLLVGSDLAMMERLTDYNRPFHQRGTELHVPPFDPAETAEMLGLGAADAIDAHLVTGGLPLVIDEWPQGHGLFDYLGEALTRPTSALIVSGERALAAEFPAEVQARRVLAAIGSGERTFSNIRRAAGDIQPMSLHRGLELLIDKRVVAADLPLSTRPSKETRYRVTDTYLRFWLRFIGPHLAEIERGRGGLVLARIRESWSSWRGRAVEPLVREAIEEMAGDARLGGAQYVGGYWTRTNDPEVDLVGADAITSSDPPVAKDIAFVGSIKWRDNERFGPRDIDALAARRLHVPGATERTPMLAVSRAGFDVSDRAIVTLTPDDLVAGWGTKERPTPRPAR